MKPTISADQFWSDLCTLIESDGVTIIQASTDDSAIVAWIPGSCLLRLFTLTEKGLEEVNVRTLCEAPKSVERARQLASLWLYDLAQQEEGE